MKIFLINHITKEQCKDTGMAMILICLLIEMFTHKHQYITLTLVILIVNMILPTIFKPLALVWFAFSRLLGTISSKILLTIIFFIIIIPVGIFRKLIGKDSMRIHQWKKQTTSVMKKRYHTFTSEDIETPYWESKKWIF